MTPLLTVVQTHHYCVSIIIVLRYKVVIVPLCVLLANASSLKKEKNHQHSNLKQFCYVSVIIHYLFTIIHVHLFFILNLFCVWGCDRYHTFFNRVFDIIIEWLRSTVALCARHNRPCGVETYFLYSYITFKRMLKTPSTVTIGGLYLRTIRW